MLAFLPEVKVIAEKYNYLLPPLQPECFDKAAIAVVVACQSADSVR